MKAQRLWGAMAVGQADSTWAAPVKGGSWGARWLSGQAWQDAFATEATRLMVWSPVLLVVGIWTYFSMAQEPPAFLALPLTIICATGLLWPRTPAIWRCAFLVVLGFSIAQFHTQRVATPLLRAYSPGQSVSGVVVDVDVRSRQRFTLVLAVKEAKGLPEAERPVNIQVTVTGKHAAPQVGDTVALVADLAPLPRPVEPGAYDHGRSLFFRSIGAVGRSKDAVKVLDTEVAWSYQLRRSFHGLRQAIGTRVKAAIKGPLGSFADALITGERASIPRSMNDSLQASGLFHILSISGLHMALVAGGAFWAVRAVLALFPGIALAWPIKKWAAAAAIVVGLLYMLLADSGAATERSFLMIAVVFFAVLVDRPALSLHNLAVAAVIILLWSPEQAVAASFQMSFMAVMGLAAFFALWQRFTPEPGGRQQPVVWRWSKKVLLLVLASLGTSVVAGLLSGIPAAHHFGRLAPYGVVANALALPIVSLVVMPAAMASVLLMPLGLEHFPLVIMGWGLEAVMLISDWVAGWRGAGLRLPLLAVVPAAVFSLAAAMLLLPVSRLRWFAAPLLLLGLVVLWRTDGSPVVLVEERAGAVALVTDDGLVPTAAKAGAASIGRWLAQRGDSATVKTAVARPGWTCSADICTGRVNGWSVAYLAGKAMPIVACPQADILVSREPLRRRCKGKRVTIDRFDVWRSGAHAIAADGTVTHVRALQGERPWTYVPRARARP